MIVYVGGVHWYGDQAVAVVSDRKVFCIADLSEDNDGADDQGQGYGELEHHQYLPWHRRITACLEGTLQNLYRVEAGKIESGIAAGEEACQKNKAYRQHPEPAIGPGHRHFFGRDGVEKGQ